MDYLRAQYIFTEPDTDAGLTQGSESKVAAVTAALPFWNCPSVVTIDAVQGRGVVEHWTGTDAAACTSFVARPSFCG